jgi:hypothetical protein
VRNPWQGEKTIVINDQTTFSKEGQTITSKDLKVGDRVFASGKEVQGQFMATQVRTGPRVQDRSGVVSPASRRSESGENRNGSATGQRGPRPSGPRFGPFYLCLARITGAVRRANPPI